MKTIKAHQLIGAKERNSHKKKILSINLPNIAAENIQVKIDIL